MEALQLNPTEPEPLVAVRPAGTEGGVVSAAADAGLNTAAAAYHVSDLVMVKRASCAPALPDRMSASAMLLEVDRIVNVCPWLVPEVIGPRPLLEVSDPKTSSPAATAAVGPESTLNPVPDLSVT